MGEEYQKFAELMGKIRSKVIDNISNQKDRADLFDSIVHNQMILDLLKQNRISEAEKKVKEIVSESLKEIKK